MRFKKVAEKLYEKLEYKDGEYHRLRKVYPVVDTEGNIKWKNFLIGSWKGLLIGLLIAAVTLGVIVEYNSNLKLCAEVMEEYNILTKNHSEIIYNEWNKDLRLDISKEVEWQEKNLNQS